MKTVRGRFWRRVREGCRGSAKVIGYGSQELVQPDIEVEARGTGHNTHSKFICLVIVIFAEQVHLDASRAPLLHAFPHELRQWYDWAYLSRHVFLSATP